MPPLPEVEVEGNVYIAYIFVKIMTSTLGKYTYVNLHHILKPNTLYLSNKYKPMHCGSQ